MVEIAVRGRNVEVSEVLRGTATEKVARVGRFLEGMERAEIQFCEERNPRIAEREVCEVTMHGHGHVVRARATGADQFMAVDRVVDKLEHRIEKLKGRLHGRSHPRRPPAPPVELGSLVDVDTEADDGGPHIVKTKKFDIKPMTPEEAVLQMELVGHDFYFFINADTGDAAVVYRRGDGNFGLIDAG